MVRMLSGTSIPGAVFLLGLFIVAAIDVYYLSINWGPFDSPDVIRSVTLHQEYYTMENALDLARLYLDTSLRYSVYQAMHDNGFRGGLSEGGTALWYNNSDAYPNEEALLKNLSSAALPGLDRYLESDYVFLDSYEVKLPQYRVDIGKTPEGGIEANATADRNLWIKRTMQNLDKVELEKNADLSENFSTAYLDLYQKALQRLEEVKSRFGEIKTELDKAKSGTLSREQENSYPEITEEEVFLEALKSLQIEAASRDDGEAKLKAKLEEILNKLKDQAGETTVQFERAVTLSAAEFSESEDCTRQETQRTEGDKTLYKTILACTFTYVYEFAVNVSVTDASRKYPVFNSRRGEISLEPLTMSFSARETG